jgi:DNA-binding HxlR family transcriptional regulator
MCQEDAAGVQGIARAIKTPEGKWKLQILSAMCGGPVRLSQLTRLLPAASKKALRASLRELESAQIVVRRDLSDTMLHVEYDFATGVREDFSALFEFLKQWEEDLEAKIERVAPHTQR